MTRRELIRELARWGAHLDGEDLVLKADAAGTGSPEVRFALTPEGCLTRNGELQSWDDQHHHLGLDGPVGLWLRWRGVEEVTDA